MDVINIWLCAVLCIFGVFNWNRYMRHELSRRPLIYVESHKSCTFAVLSDCCVRTSLRNKSVFNVFALNFDIHFMSLGSHSWKLGDFFSHASEVKNEISDPVWEIIIFTSCYWTLTVGSEWNAIKSRKRHPAPAEGRLAELRFGVVHLNKNSARFHLSVRREDNRQLAWMINWPKPSAWEDFLAIHH